MLEFPISFENPTFGIAGVVLGAVVVALFYFSYKRLRIAQKRLELVEWRKLRRIVRTLNIGTKTGVVIALSFLLARPYFPTTIEVSVNEASLDQLAQFKITSVLLMDVSLSMNQSDLKPTRLDAAKAMSNLLIEKMDPKDLVGFVSFAGRLYDTVYPTTNRTKITESIANQTIHNSTAIGTALETATGMLENLPGAKAIVLFSDGKSNTGIDVALAVDTAVTLKIPIFTVSVGTYGVGESDPLALKEISDKTGGKFYEVRNEDMQNLATSISQISQEVKTGALRGVYDKLTLPSKDYQTPTMIFSSLLVATLFLMWFTGV